MGFSGTRGPLSENIGGCGLEYIFCLKLSIKLCFDRPLESPSTNESGFEVMLERSVSVSPECSGPGVDGRVGTGAGVGTGVGTGVGDGADTVAGAGTGGVGRVRVGVGSGFDGIGGGETKAVLSAFSFTRASAAASLSAFCCFRMRSTAGIKLAGPKKGRNFVITVIPSSP